MPKGRYTPGIETSEYRQEKKTNSDTLSSSERKGRRASRISDGNVGRDVVWSLAKSTTQNFLERNASEGDSPVEEVDMLNHKKSRVSWIGGLNMGELTPNPKY
jgi:hypothetical protein